MDSVDLEVLTMGARQRLRLDDTCRTAADTGDRWLSVRRVCTHLAGRCRNANLRK
jgi:hypothetical protein